MSSWTWPTHSFYRSRQLCFRFHQVHGVDVGAVRRGVPRHLHRQPGRLHDYPRGVPRAEGHRRRPGEGARGSPAALQCRLCPLSGPLECPLSAARVSAVRRSSLFLFLSPPPSRSRPRLRLSVTPPPPSRPRPSTAVNASFLFTAVQSAKKHHVLDHADIRFFQ